MTGSRGAPAAPCSNCGVTREVRQFPYGGSAVALCDGCVRTDLRWESVDRVEPAVPTADDRRVTLAVKALGLRKRLRSQRNGTEWDLAVQAVEDVLADILHRHKRGDDGYLMGHDECGWCTEVCVCEWGGPSIPWPCPEVRNVLDAVVPRTHQKTDLEASS